MLMAEPQLQITMGPIKFGCLQIETQVNPDIARLVPTEEENGADFPIPEDPHKVEINCATDPTLSYYLTQKLNGTQ